MSIRAFWEDTWAESGPVPASEQRPLFDPSSTAEMVLHALETLHPALLMNQALAVQLGNARFALEAAAGPAVDVGRVAASVGRMGRAVDRAMEALAVDATGGFLHGGPASGPTGRGTGGGAVDAAPELTHVSSGAVRACEDACDRIGEAELCLTRALCLLRRLPGRGDLVDGLLGRYGTAPPSAGGRAALLGAVGGCGAGGGGEEAEPGVREYVLDHVGSSCRLSARLASVEDRTTLFVENHTSLAFQMPS